MSIFNMVVANLTGTEDLLEAAMNGETEKVKALVAEVPARLNTVDRQGRTALMYAAKNGHTQTVTTLVELGADIDRVDRSLCDAVWHAKNDDMVALLESLKEAKQTAARLK